MRGQRQQLVIEAILKKLTNAGSVTKLATSLMILTDNSLQT